MEIRTFEAHHAPAIVDLWNRRVNGCFATGPLSTEVFVRDVAGKSYFEPAGLILAFKGSRLVSFAHAGFKSSDHINPDRRFGTISMICAEAGHEDAGEQCIRAAASHLLACGARLLEAFTIDFPNTPFYNGLYGGEKAGMDEEHPMGFELMRKSGFIISNGAVIMTCSLGNAPEPAELPGGLSIRIGDWEGPMRGLPPNACYGIPERVRQATLLADDGRQMGQMIFWHLDRYNSFTGRRVAVVSRVGVSPEVMGTGAAAALQGEVHRLLMQEGAEEMGLGTGGGNIRAIRFYTKMGYKAIKPAFSFHLDWRRYADFK